MKGREEFAGVYDEHVWDVYGFLAYRLRSRHDVEDLTQQTFERALKAWKRFDPERATARTWLISIARNLLIDHYRRDRSAQRESLADRHEDLADKNADPDQGLGLSADLELALHQLGDRERELLALRFGADLTGPEIADLTDLSLANVHQILSRSLRRLRSELNRSGEEVRPSTRGSGS